MSDAPQTMHLASYSGASLWTLSLNVVRCVFCLCHVALSLLVGWSRAFACKQEGRGLLYNLLIPAAGVRGVTRSFYVLCKDSRECGRGKQGAEPLQGGWRCQRVLQHRGSYCHDTGSPGLHFWCPPLNQCPGLALHSPTSTYTTGRCFRKTASYQESIPQVDSSRRAAPQC